MNGILSYATAITSIAIAVTLGGFGVIQTENIVNANRSFALQQEIEKSIRDSKSMAANWSTSYTMGGVSHTYGGTVTLKRPNLFQLKVGPPYNNSYISNGTEIQEHKWAGTEREEYKTVPLKPGETPTQLMDLSLAYLYMTADLNGFGRLLFQESPQMVDAGTEKRNGVTYRLLELRGSKDRHLVRLYILPNRLVAGMYTETESNTAEETPGGRVAKREWTTGLTFLRDIRIDKPVSETAFDFNKRPDTLVEKQSPMLIAGNQAPDFDVINPMDDKHISLSNLLQGKNAVLVNFWFSGCAPCREEFPHLQNLYNEFKDKGFDMIALDGSWADGSKVIRSFLTKNHYTFRAGLALHTQKRLEADDIAWRYGVQSYPSSFLVGANGRILWSGVGYDEKALRNALALAGLN